METIKEEKKADLEQLLNKLIQRGWKPRNVISKNTYIYKVKDKINLSYSEFLEDEGECMHEDEWYSLRDLVSKSSGLWQFVCENGMVKGDEGIYWHKNGGKISDLRTYDYEFENFWIIESALKDESELEEFLLNSIKLD